jgi:hypothetical protein
MRRLTRHQLVEIDIDDELDPILGRVKTVSGPVATVTRVHQSEPLPDRMASGALSYLVFEHNGTLVALRGVSIAAADQAPNIEFVVIDGVQLPERRVAERVRLAARARISGPGREPGGDDPVDTVIDNISLGGVLVEKHIGLAAQPQFELELFFDSDPAPISARAEVARRTPTHIGMKFIDIAPVDRVRLAGIIARDQRRTPQRV